MKAIKIAGMGLLATAVLIVIVIIALPSHVHMERSVVIQATPAQVYAVVNNYQNFNKWSPWARLDPNTQFKFTGPVSGVGATMTWISDHDQVGTGLQRIIEVEENKHVKNEITFNGMDSSSFADMTLSPEGTATKVTWTYEGEMSGLYKLSGPFMDNMLGPFYERGLSFLKEFVESRNDLEPLEEGPVTPAESVSNP